LGFTAVERVDEPAAAGGGPISSAARELLSSNEIASGSAGSMSKCCWPLRAVAPPHSAVILMNAPACGHRGHHLLQTAAAIDTAQSVRPRPANAGNRRTSKRTSSDALRPCGLPRFLRSSRHWSCRIRKVIYDLLFPPPVRKLFSKSLATPDTSARKLGFFTVAAHLESKNLDFHPHVPLRYSCRWAVARSHALDKITRSVSFFPFTCFRRVFPRQVCCCSPAGLA